MASIFPTIIFINPFNNILDICRIQGDNEMNSPISYMVYIYAPLIVFINAECTKA
jgi:hypothetical protein